METLLRDGLASISSAPLKPYQRLYIATYHLLPKCQHQLVLAPASTKYLKWLNRMVRSAVRSWLKLPKDTTIPFFHAPVVEGGLGVPLQEHVVPLMKAKRLSRLKTSPDPVIAAMLRTVSASAGLAKQTRRSSLNGREITSSNDLKATLAAMLHHSADGRGLANASQVPECHRWVNSVRGSGAPNTASSYIAAIKVRGNLIGTALRTSRGRPQASTRCDCCGRVESLGHILQVCPRTHASRIARHDKILDLVGQALTQKGHAITREPAIPTPAGIRRPDLMVMRGSAVTVIDVMIVADNADLARAHGSKCEYYDVPSVREWIRDRYGTNEITFSAIALNWRGSMALQSARGLRSLGVSGPFLGLLSFVTLECGNWIVNHFHRSTYAVR